MQMNADIEYLQNHEASNPTQSEAPVSIFRTTSISHGDSDTHASIRRNILGFIL